VFSQSWHLVVKIVLPVVRRRGQRRTTTPPDPPSRPSIPRVLVREMPLVLVVVAGGLMLVELNLPLKL
jgi:hypothetical protein